MLLIRNGLVYTMEEKKPIYADILIKMGKIEKIGENITPSPEMKIIDAKGKLVFPGFIDAHSHIGIAEDKISSQNDTSNENAIMFLNEVLKLNKEFKKEIEEYVNSKYDVEIETHFGGQAVYSWIIGVE